MSIFTGSEAKAYYVEETVYGVTPSGPGQPAMLYIGIIEDMESAFDPENLVLYGIGKRSPITIRRRVRSVDLSLVYTPQDWSFWQYATNRKSVSLELFYEKGASIISMVHRGLKIDKAKIEGSVEDPVKITMEGIAQDLAVGTSKIGASYAAESTNAPIMTLDCVVRKAGVEITRFTDFTLEINNHLVRKPVIRATTPHLIKSLPERSLTLSGSITADFESRAELDEILGDSSFSLTFEIGPLGNRRTFTFNGCKWRSIKTPTKTDELVSQTLEFDALSLTEA